MGPPCIPAPLLRHGADQRNGSDPLPRHDESRVLPYTPDQMYALVADVESYPQFLPWCAAARIRARRDEGAAEVLEADLVISFRVFRETFASRVTLHPETRVIDTEYL